MTCSYVAMLGPLTKWKEAGLIWSSILLPRQRIIIWIAYQNRLLTKEKIQRINILVDSEEYYLCDERIKEMSKHLFAGCKWISEVRSELENWAGIHIIQADAKQCLQWIKNRRWKQFKKEVVIAIWGAMVYYTWQVRN